MHHPSPKTLHPIKDCKHLVFLNQFVDHMNGIEKFKEENVIFNNKLGNVKLVIGKFCAIAAKAVVVKNVPAYSIVAGNPTKVVKIRFDEHTIQHLEKLAWLDWDIEKMTRNLKSICRLNLDLLEEAH